MSNEAQSMCGILRIQPSVTPRPAEYNRKNGVALA
jgi:hypothetical protein